MKEDTGQQRTVGFSHLWSSVISSSPNFILEQNHAYNIQISMRKRKRGMASCWLNILSKKLTACILFLVAVKTNPNIKGLWWYLGYAQLLRILRWRVLEKMAYFWGKVRVWIVMSVVCIQRNMEDKWIYRLWGHFPIISANALPPLAPYTLLSFSIWRGCKRGKFYVNTYTYLFNYPKDLKVGEITDKANIGK